MRNGRWTATLLWAVFAAGTSAAAGSGTSTGLFATMDDGARIHYLDTGPKNKLPALFLIPGWRLTANVWREQIDRFSRDRRVIAMDPRSQGESSKTADGNTPARRARDIHALIEKVKLRAPVLVGWSQGVQDVAAYVATFGCDSVSGFVLVDSPVSAGPEEIELHKEASKNELSLLNIYAEHPKEYSEGMMANVFKKRPPPREFDRLVSDSLKTPTSIGVSMLIADLFAVDRRSTLPKFNKPTLIIASAESPTLDAQKEMIRSMPNARLEVVADAGHAVFADQPERFDNLVSAFLEGIRPQPAAKEARMKGTDRRGARV